MPSRPAPPLRRVGSGRVTAELAGKLGRNLSSILMSARPHATDLSNGQTILIVEDDLETRLYYTDALERGGFRVDQAHNGHQAFEKALKSPPDLILTDIAVPGIDGIELCRRLRADVRTRSIPLLAITGYGDRQYPDRALMAGADHVLAKPCDPELIVSEARRLLLLLARDEV